MSRVLITAGPTREPIDPVRFISNRSSGRLGLALTEAAAAAGHEVTLLAGPGVAVRDAPAACRVEPFGSTEDLLEKTSTMFAEHDVLIMAAAVSDYRPVHQHPGKLPRQADGRLVLELEATPDVVASLAAGRRGDQTIIAFALEEPATLEARAREKLRRKGVDAIVANPLATMDAADIEPVWFDARGHREAPGAMNKRDFATWLIERIATLRDRA